MAPHATLPARARKQRGAAAIELALLFTIFFALVYGVISYSFVMLMQQGLAQASAEGARAAIKLDPTLYNAAQAANFEADATNLAKSAVKQALSWMPSDKQTLLGNNIEVTYTTSNVSLSTGTTVLAKYIKVKVTYPNYKSNPILPIVDLPIIGQVPQVPNDLNGASTVRLTP